MNWEPVPYRILGLDSAPLPRMINVKQSFPEEKEADIPRAIQESVDKLMLPSLKGKRIALTAGSRGIPNILLILKTIINILKDKGAEPFIVPAMGSHGGGSAEGQRKLLHEYGITEHNMNTPILSSLETVLLGETRSGMRVYCDKLAYNSDGIVVCNRIKAHTDFKAEIESGLCKMMVVGLGKQKGASEFHKHESASLGSLLSEAAELFLSKAPVIFSLAILDNAYHETLAVEAIAPEQILDKERLLLREAKKAMPRLLLNEIDVLVVDEVGKEISGAGMDSNITGRATSGIINFPAPPIKRIAVLRLTPSSQGNAAGIGVADFISLDMARSIDLRATYTNSLTSSSPLGSKLPVVMNNDRETIAIATLTCNRKKTDEALIVRIRNTLNLDIIQVSESYCGFIQNHSKLKVLSKAFVLGFDKKGSLTTPI